MKKIKILEIKDHLLMSKIGIDDFLNSVSNIVGYPLEIVHEIEEHYDGFYIIPICGVEHMDVDYKKYINGRTFLLSLYNGMAIEFIDNYKPMGLNNWSLFKNSSTEIIGNEKALNLAGYTKEHSEFIYNGYKSALLTQSDGTYNAVAKAFILYCELYDKYLETLSH